MKTLQCISGAALTGPGHVAISMQQGCHTGRRELRKLMTIIDLPSSLLLLMTCSAASLCYVPVPNVNVRLFGQETDLLSYLAGLARLPQCCWQHASCRRLLRSPNKIAIAIHVLQLMHFSICLQCTCFPKPTASASNSVCVSVMQLVFR